MIPAWFLSFGKSVAGDLSGALADAYAAKKRAETDEERLAQEERIKRLLARQEVILAAQGDPIERFVRIGFAAPFVLYAWKTVVWDKVVKGNWAMGSTDPLSAELSTIFMIVLGGYFVDTAVRRIFRR